ncbi:MerR family transcriptional regulator [Streptomyces sp. NPDC007808]|uniref:MerR family transcriptional regulator n=1 Tax=Streptomyces sp. NPDC007808 TaxID=3364779 RepID=UPI0036BA2B36
MDGSAVGSAPRGSGSGTTDGGANGRNGGKGAGGRPAPAAPVPEAPLATGAVARRIGVSPTTVRSWDRRYGIGPAGQSGGRHRRWSPQDVAVLETMCRLTSAGVPPAEAARVAKQGGSGLRAEAAAPEAVAPEAVAPGPPSPQPPSPEAPEAPEAPEDRPGPSDAARPPGPSAPPAAAPAGRRSHAAGALPLGDVRQECRGLARAAVRLDAPAVDDQLAAAVDRHGVVVAWQEVMVPTLHAVGRKWASSGDRYVEVEHLLSWHVSSVLRRCTRSVARQGDGSGPVVLACVPGEQHTLPLEALNAALSEQGVSTRMFGAAVPVEALTAAVQRIGPAAVVLWAQARSTASLPLARHVAAAQWGVRGARSQPLVLLGGSGWAGRSAAGMLRPSSLRDALDVLADAGRLRGAVE